MVKFQSGENLRTPLLVPSFSSRVAEIEKIFRASEEFLDGSFLISAFDVAKKLIAPPFDFAGPIFLDSGGYEIGTDSDLSDVSSEPSGVAEDWTLKELVDVHSKWKATAPTVVISYDHPQIRRPIGEQIRDALSLPLPNQNCAREILLKPETKDQKFVRMDSVLEVVRDLAPFQVIGVTEKEIGNSVFDRMVNVAKLRLALRKIDLDIPIHVFGSLDSITTLFYFVAGADIFDGLTWLRYAFKDGRTYYRQDFGISEFGISLKSPQVEALCWTKNYNYLKDMELEMRRFLNECKFEVFRFHRTALEQALQNVEEVLSHGR